LSNNASIGDNHIRIIQYDINHNKDHYEKCLNYFEDLYNSKDSKSLQDIKDEANIDIEKGNITKPLDVTANLAKAWDKYIDWQKGDPPEGSFLEKIIEHLHKPKSKVSILDAAAATGRETIFLYKKGYDIYANNVDMNLRDYLIDNLKIYLGESYVKVPATTYDWRLFSKYFNRKFDVVILLGNSLARLLKECEISRTINECYEILNPGGIFIVDKRNFDKILTHKDKDICSFKGFYNNFYKSKFLYCGQEVRGWPKSITKDVIDFSVGYNPETSNFIFKMYPFKKRAFEC
jgi:SAM-dependent methyltransferase